MFVPLVFFHELGHFIMAKAGGIRVSKFCFGFGKKLVGFHYKGTEYCWNLLPLGGYVDFMGDVVYTQEIPEDAKHFYNRPKWIRFLVLIMGPLFNVILAFVVFWIYFAFLLPFDWVSSEDKLTVSHVVEGSPEAGAGLQPDDVVLAFDGREVTNPDDVFEHLLYNPGKQTTFTVLRDGQKRQIRFEIDRDETNGVGQINFDRGYRLQIQDVQADSPAETAGLQAEDVLIAVNGKSLLAGGAEDTRGLIQEQFAANAPGQSTLTVSRGGTHIDVTVTPEQRQNGDWIAGFAYGAEGKRVPISAIGAFTYAWDELLDKSMLIFRGIERLVTGVFSIKALSSPVGVAQAAKESWDISPIFFIWLMAVISLNLGILNLLPIPVLDGGEILVLLIEGITRKDFAIMTKMQIKLVGFVFLIGLMGVVIVNDIIKAVSAAGAG